ncbi:MAG: hypothetical protein IIY58_03385 [Aeriscardovia sp.]|nr:hypothetical protein [Aeriscardovia sp.]
MTAKEKLTKIVTDSLANQFNITKQTRKAAEDALESFWAGMTDEAAEAFLSLADKMGPYEKFKWGSFEFLFTFLAVTAAANKAKENGTPEDAVKAIHEFVQATFAGDSNYKKAFWDEFAKLTENEEAAQNLPAAYYSMVTNGALPSFLMRLLNNPVRIVGRGITVIDGLPEGKRRIEFKSKGEFATIELANFLALFNKQVRNGAKALKFFLEKATDQHTNTPVFTLSELVDRGIYTTEKNAYTGLNNIIDKLQNIRISIEWKETRKNEKTGKKQTNKDKLGGPIIGQYFLSTSRQCRIFLYDGLYYLSKQYFTVFPAWGWALPDQAFILLDYILYVARQRTKEIKDSFDAGGGKFEIKIDTIREKMGLPTPKDAGYRHQQLIISPIEEAIVAIEDMQNKNGQPEITITPVYDETGKIADFLEGHLEIGLKGKVYDYMATRAKAIEDHTPPKIAEAQTKRRTRAKTKKEGGNQQ